MEKYHEVIFGSAYFNRIIGCDLLYHGPGESLSQGPEHTILFTGIILLRDGFLFAEFYRSSINTLYAVDRTTQQSPGESKENKKAKKKKRKS